MSDILDPSFEPKAVTDHFIELTKLYHPDAKEPGKRVIVLRRKGLGSYASSPYVALQAHMDMVSFPDKNIFPLQVFGYYYDKSVKWIKTVSGGSILHPEKGTTLGELVQIQKTIGKISNYDVSAPDPSPIWQPDEQSELLTEAKGVYKKANGEEYKTTVIHAGLKCSYVVKKYDGKMDCISIGPTIVNPHTGRKT